MPSSRITQRFTMLAAICALAAISAPTVHSAYLPLDIEDASVIASKIPVSASKANHLASAIRPGPVQSSHREPGQATHREHHATTHVQSALHPTVTGVKESEQATHHEHHTTTRAQSASYPAVTGAPTSSRLPLPMPLLLALPQHLLKEQPRSAEDSGGEGSSVTPRKLGETPVLDLLNPLLLFEEIADALSRADPQSQSLAQRGPGEHVPQAAFDAHVGLETHGQRDSKQNPVISSGEHGTGGEGAGSGMRKREGKGADGDEDDSGVPGTIDIMSATSNSTGLQHIGSLVLAKADMSAAPADQTFFLNASSTHQTQMYLLPIHPAGPKSTSTSSDNTDNTDSDDHAGHTVTVALQLPMFDPASAAMVRYCATFHPRAAQPEPLAVERCLPEYRSRAAGTSQVFAYDSPTGVVRPMWFDGDDGEPHHQDADYADADAASEELDGATGAGMFARNIGFDLANSTAAAHPASPAANSTAPMSGARDVTLVFKPVAPEASTQTDVIAAAASDDDDDSLALALALDSNTATSASSAVSFSGSTSSQSAMAQPSPAVNEAVWTTTTASSASSATSGAGSSFVSSGSSMATEANLVGGYPISMGYMQSDSTEAATATATLPPGSVASYPASAGVSPVNAEASASPTASAGSGNSLGPMHSSSAAPLATTASDAGDADANIAAAGPSSSSPSASSASTSSTDSGTWPASSSTPVPMTVAAAAQTAASISSPTPVEGAGASPSLGKTSATTSVSESPVFTNINAEGPVSSLASSSVATSTPSSTSTSTASTTAPAASPSSFSAEAIASLIADTAFSTLAAPPTASSPTTETAMAVEEYSPPFGALAEAGPGSVAAGAPTPLAEDAAIVPEEWVFAPEARL
ncbi:hypothetical protein FIBSPDRAFT_1039438 [Athelia psychrophila]|uniref:Uncharacterized protein n=1 Tax=Athelia psychrophila TaxID=1759441 RepID=A0A166RVD7_9AGAM|nr:hypothetical protein FIBSPDRAFT_1039438 [Fibularhizoctonia sp. CBS 109695]